jgi:two-component system sensor histidine kinase HydH
MMKGIWQEQTVKRFGIYMTFLLVAFSIIMGSSSFWTYRLSIQAALGNLRTSATNIAVNLDFTLNHLGLKKQYFQKLVVSGEWEAVAFIALLDKDGSILLHSNTNLIGQRLEDPFIREVLKTGIPSDHYLVLGTGEKVFVLDYPIHLHIQKRFKTTILRIALHTYPAMGIVRKARVQLTLSLAALGVLWILTLLLLTYIRKSYAMERELSEKKRLALLGEMAAVLAHEIRNPIGSIKGFAQLLLEKKDTGDPEREFLQIMVEESVRLEKLVKDLLVYARSEKISPSHVDLNSLIQECLKQFQEANVSFTTDVQEPCSLYTDRDKLKEIILNLIQNAIEATKEKDNIHIRVQRAPGHCVIEVIDHGEGMEKETIDKIFQPFFTTKTKGTGLGLSIVKKLLENLDGKIEVESTFGKGTITRVILSQKRMENGNTRTPMRKHKQPQCKGKNQV